MAHKFYKSGSNTSGLPGRTDDKLFSRLKKYAHDVWQVSSDGGAPSVNRLRADAVEVREEPEAGGEEVEHAHAHPERDDAMGSDLNSGDLVLLFMGGQRIYARIKDMDGRTATISTHDGEYEVDSSWLKSAQAEKQPEQPSNRTITREDIPAQGGQPQTQDPVYAKSVQVLTQMLQASGGRALVGMGFASNGKESMMELTQNPDGGVSVKMIELVPKVFHQGQYQSLQQLVQDLGLSAPGNMSLKNAPKNNVE
jgi:hypothetical protein